MAKLHYDTVREVSFAPADIVRLSDFLQDDGKLCHLGQVIDSGPDPVLLAQVKDVIEAVVSGRKYEVLLLRSQGKTISEIVESTDIGLEKNPESMVRKLAQHVAPEEGLGLSMIGPFENNTNYIALYHWNRGEILKRGRNFQDSDHNRKWISIQGLDWIRRMLLGKLKSPID